MRAKMRVAYVKSYGTWEELSLNAVTKSGSYPDDGSDEDNTYAKFTPSANLIMSITNPNLVGKFRVGQTFYVDFTEVEGYST